MSEQRVVNTSPLIYLSRAGMLQLLQDAGSDVIVPQAVADEIFAWPTADAAQAALNSTPWLKITPAVPIPLPVAAWDLGSGESSVLALGSTYPGYTLVLDDLAARRCAAALGLAVRGTVGLVLHARQRGLIPSAREALLALIHAGMFLSDKVRDAALRNVGE